MSDKRAAAPTPEVSARFSPLSPLRLHAARSLLRTMPWLWAQLTTFRRSRDTSTILKWLILEGYTIVCFLATRRRTLPPKKALAPGAERMIIDNLQQEFVDELIFRAIQCSAIYEDRNLLGTSLARPVIARAQVQAAHKYKCNILSHGCTVERVRFELAWKACDPSLSVIAPWRMPKFINRFQGRADLLEFAAENGIRVSSSPKAPWSMDDPLEAPNDPTKLLISFKEGIPVKLEIGSETMTGSLAIFMALNQVAGKNGVGRIDIVESRFIGLKSRGCYDSPAMTVLRLAHIDIEGLVLDSKVKSICSYLLNEWSQCLYNGWGLCPRPSSETSNLYSETEASMDTLEGFSPEDTSGLLAIQAIRLAKYGAAKIQQGEPLARGL
ncbi:hypothetical protein QQX98_007276 [Neonectria punicea]|uniref:argininosuccinate synthase n=1 Tax=Neonectria punicea TaxID=979145 RepID=A0ABR1GYE6_9HYPO